jgi:hypothetical protein
MAPSLPSLAAEAHELGVRLSADDLAQLFVGPEYRRRFAPRGTERAFHVSVFPSFSDYVGYELLRETASGDDEAWLLSRRTWLRLREEPGPRAVCSVVAVVGSTAKRWLTNRVSRPLAAERVIRSQKPAA